MQFQKKEKRQTTVRFDSHHVRLRTGEVQRKTGSYMYRWTDKLGKRNTIYAATLEDLREQEEQILVDQHDGIKVFFAVQIRRCFFVAVLFDYASCSIRSFPLLGKIKSLFLSGKSQILQ